MAKEEAAVAARKATAAENTAVLSEPPDAESIQDGASVEDDPKGLNGVSDGCTAEFA